MDLSETNIECAYLLLSLYAVAVTEPTTVPEICEYIEQADTWVESVPDEEIKQAVEVLAENELVSIDIDPYSAYVVSLATDADDPFEMV